MSTERYIPRPDDLVHCGLSATEWRVIAVLGEVAWVRSLTTGEDKIKSILRMVMVEAELVEDPSDNDAPLGHFLDSFLSVPKVA